MLQKCQHKRKNRVQVALFTLCGAEGGEEKKGKKCVWWLSWNKQNERIGSKTLSPFLTTAETPLFYIRCLCRCCSPFQQIPTGSERAVFTPTSQISPLKIKVLSGHAAFREHLKAPEHHFSLPFSHPGMVGLLWKETDSVGKAVLERFKKPFPLPRKLSSALQGFLISCFYTHTYSTIFKGAS